jgi:hypothetical protein
MGHEMSAPIQTRWGALVPAALLAWLVMLAVSLAGGTLVEAQVGPVDLQRFDEYLTAFALAMPAPFAFVILVAFWPAAIGVRGVFSARASPWRYGMAGALIGPFAGIFFFLLSGIYWAPADVGIVTYISGKVTGSGAWRVIPPLTALVIGGFVFGFAFCRLHRTLVIDPSRSLDTTTLG